MKWININKQLPTKDGEYIVVTELHNEKYIRILKYDKDDEEWMEYDLRYDEFVCVGDVTHWQPLPKAPK